MDFKKLIEPYQENGRTPEGQMKWLLSKGIPQANVDQAMLFVYNEISGGKTFPSGHELDRYLLTKAQEFQKGDVEANVQRLQDFFGKFKEGWQEEMKKQARPGFWQRVKAVFVP